MVKERSKALGAKENVLGKALRALRGDLGISLGTLARAVGLSQKTVQKIEQTPDPTLSEVRRYVAGLGGDLELTVRLPEASIKTLMRSGQTSGARLAQLEPQQLALGDFLVEALVPRKDVVFSIRPIHAERILAGSKTVELRRRFSDSVGAGSFAFIYTTSPTSALTGLAEIRGVQQLPVKDLWHHYGEAACLSKPDFDEYFSGLRTGYANANGDDRTRSEILDDQDLLVQEFRKLATPEARPIVLDGHSVIDTEQGFVNVPAEVVQGLNAAAILFLRAEPDTIVARRHSDHSRIRPHRTVQQIADYQAAALAMCLEYKVRLGIRTLVINQASFSDFEEAALTLLGMRKS